MLINDSDRCYYLNRDGDVIEGQVGAPPADAASLLVGPGGGLDEATAARHGLLGTLKDAKGVDLHNPVTGEPIVLVDGRAFGGKSIPHRPAPVLPPHAVPAPAVVHAEPKVPAPAAPASPAAKHVPGPAETKAAPSPEKK